MFTKRTESNLGYREHFVQPSSAFRRVQDTFDPVLETSEDPRCASTCTCMAWCTFYPAKTASFEKIDRVWKTSFHDPLECRELWSFQRAGASDRAQPLPPLSSLVPGVFFLSRKASLMESRLEPFKTGSENDVLTRPDLLLRAPCIFNRRKLIAVDFERSASNIPASRIGSHQFSDVPRDT